MSEVHRSYLPAAGHDWALPLYDPLVKLFGGDRIRRTLVELAALGPAQRVLEIGCGTGSVLLELKRRHPEVEVVGLDPDPNALARARRKAERAGARVQLDQGFADELPYPDASFDRVFSSFMFHHLESSAKEQTLREVGRVLKPGGYFHLLDFAGPEAGHGFLARLLHAHHHLQDNAEDRVLALMRQAGLVDPAKTAQGAFLFGHSRVNYYLAAAPAPAIR